MEKKYSAENFFTTMQENMKNSMGSAPAMSAFDMKAAMEMQRKNMQAMTDINQTVMNGWQELARRQAEMMAQFVQNNNAANAEEAPQGAFQRQAEVIKNVCEKSMANSQELIEMIRKNNLQTAEVITERLMNSMAEMKKSVKSNG